MDLARQLAPFVTDLSDTQLGQISTYIDLLLRWNARINLTAVRAPEEIVTRHFGESLFAACHLLPAATAIDVGSGAGFPGLPLKIYDPALRLALIESNSKKAAFLKEVCRALTFTDVDVFCGRAEAFAGQAELVTLRAVERFRQILPVAAPLVAPSGRLALLIGASQATTVARLLPGFRLSPAIPIPHSSSRILLIAENLPRQESGSQ